MQQLGFGELPAVAVPALHTAQLDRSGPSGASACFGGAAKDKAAASSDTSMLTGRLAVPSCQKWTSLAIYF